MLPYYLYLLAIFSAKFLLFFFGAIIIRCLIIKDEDDERVFQFANIKDENFVRQTVIYLEQKNQITYPKMYDFIDKYFMDGRLTENEKGKLEEFIVHIYFKSFSKRWMAFRMSSWYLKVFFILSIVTAWIHFNSIFFAKDLLFESNTIDWGFFIPVNILGIIVVYVISAGYLTLFSMFLQIISSIFRGRKGRIVKCYIAIDEMIKCFKPAGRKTEFKIAQQKANFRNF